MKPEVNLKHGKYRDTDNIGHMNQNKQRNKKSDNTDNDKKRSKMPKWKLTRTPGVADKGIAITYVIIRETSQHSKHVV